MRRLRWIEAVVLELLEAQPNLYGLELVRESAGKLKRGTIYVLLGRMVRRGLVTGQAARSETQSGRPRPCYRMTPLGARALLDWRKLR